MKKGKKPNVSKMTLNGLKHILAHFFCVTLFWKTSLKSYRTRCIAVSPQSWRAWWQHLNDGCSFGKWRYIANKAVEYGLFHEWVSCDGVSAYFVLTLRYISAAVLPLSQTKWSPFLDVGFLRRTLTGLLRGLTTPRKKYKSCTTVKMKNKCTKSQL